MISPGCWAAANPMCSSTSSRRCRLPVRPGPRCRSRPSKNSRRSGEARNGSMTTLLRRASCALTSRSRRPGPTRARWPRGYGRAAFPPRLFPRRHFPGRAFPRRACPLARPGPAMRNLERRPTRLSRQRRPRQPARQPQLRHRPIHARARPRRRNNRPIRRPWTLRRRAPGHPEQRHRMLQFPRPAKTHRPRIARRPRQQQFAPVPAHPRHRLRHLQPARPRMPNRRPPRG